MNLKEVKDFYQSLTEVKEEIKEFSSVAVCELDGGIKEWKHCKESIYVFLEKQEEFVLKYFARNFPTSFESALKIPDFDFDNFAKLLLLQKQLICGNEKKLFSLVKDILNYPPCEKIKIGKDFFSLLEEEPIKVCIGEDEKTFLIGKLSNYCSQKKTGV